ncbi:sensor histidine kinase [[Kitasatospora] papulosa]|uniref:sensor histidine kinase n=1 Tax=Streptomyces TaxID=1883 RepID=UPI00068A5D9F|nr:MULTISPECIES: sensor histidine kinase [Streptomyces]RAS36201.1 two-component system sensor histidine kinase DesK [Streptomyces avidinii]TPN09258.1 sensor histidine kinase [Mesorhizobium sp. B2-3-3]SNX71871.1 two-component system, NarL family, sensor histidine kinase DesK [Streptomyces microflavus]MCX4415816.1 sensor histidine kinase [[Kitasatospora] papulosa]MCY1651746.1 sensor histidine kinase [Streptomyces sp. SL203]
MSVSVEDWVERLGGQDGPERYRRYAVGSVGFLALTEVGLWTIWMFQSDGDAPVLATVAVLGAVHAVIQFMLWRSALRHYLTAGPRPTPLVAAYTALTLAMATVGCVLLATGRIDDGDLTSYLVWLLMFWAGPPALALSPRRGAALVAVVAVAALAGAGVAGLPGPALVLAVSASVFMVPFMAAASRASGWSVRLIEQLAAARETQSRLAVAEERLRFGRDLHDVLGRNLAVVALKSELAAQLARRGLPEAEEHMAEVQRIARESQREIRSVVRGYRTADLHTELVGARSVLEAAGIDCRIEYGPADRLPPDVQSALGWVVREGTTNVLRHAQAATRCTMALRTAGPTTALLVLENDGAPDTPSGGGTGLAGLRERLAGPGGTLTTEHQPGGIFRLTARIPWEEDA